MNEKSLIIVSFVIFFLGSLIMIGLSTVDPSETQINDITKGMVGEFVTVEGSVSSLRNHGSNTFFDIIQGSHSIKAVIFNSNTKINNGDEIRAIGEISLYNGNLEIIVEKITILDS